MGLFTKFFTITTTSLQLINNSRLKENFGEIPNGPTNRKVLHGDLKPRG